MLKELIGAAAVILTFAAYVPYYRDVLRGKTRPHVYSWSLWGLLTVLLVALQIKGGAGPATWVTAAAGLLCVGIVVLSLKNGKRDITTPDTIVAILSLLAIGFWLIADQPVIAMALAILADLLAFIPTVRKSYHDPHSETLSLYITNALRFVLALFAVENYTYLSSAWIVAWIAGNALLAVLLIVRRKQVAILPHTDQRQYIDTVAYICVKDGKILSTRSKGKDAYYIPGGKRDAGESDVQTLVREVKEELGVDLVPGTIVHYGTFEAQAHGKPEGTMVRMACYTADFTGEPVASSEKEEIMWLGYDGKGRSSPVDQLVFDDLKAKGLLQ